MDIKQLRYFLGVLEARSITKAAETMAIAQPALGLQIRKLEDELGADLLVRHSRGITPTEAGLRLAQHAESLLRQFDRMHQDMVDFAGARRSLITVGMSETTTLLITAALAERIQQDHPTVRLTILEGLNRQLVDWLESDRVDLALTFEPPDDPELICEPLVDELLHFIQPIADGAVRGSIRFADILGRDLILPSRPQQIRQLVDSRAQALGRTVEPAFEVDSVRTIKEFVRRGLGCSVLPLSAIINRLEARQMDATLIIEPEIARTLHLVCAQRHKTSKPFLAVRAAIRSIAVELAKDEAFGWRAPQKA
jgi:LysR family nitrogen assimilation transcriptional regulator